MKTHPWILAIRPKTLPASISPILIGNALAYDTGVFQLSIFILCLLCALALQIAVNLANDYFDAKSGVDTAQRLGPVRVVQAGLIEPAQIMKALVLSCGVAVISGLAIVWLSSPWLLLFGGLSLLGVFFYSAGPKPLASMALGEVTVFLFFGWLAVGGSYYAQTLQITVDTMVFASIAGLLSAAIMLVNNIRDRATDETANKHTLVVLMGDTAARKLYCAFLILCVLLQIGMAVTAVWALLLSVVVLAWLAWGLCKKIYERKGAQLNQQLAQTAALGLIYSLLTSGTLLFS